MSRDFFEIEKGLSIAEENSDNSIKLLTGSAAPDGLGDQASADIGSLYIRRGTGELYQKIANVGASSDWDLNGSGSSSVIPIFRNIVVRAATGDAVVAGSVDPSAFSDNESGLDGNDFTVGEYLISGVGGTPQLYEVTVVTGATDITLVAASPALADNDGFIVRTYLPDSPGAQENQALVAFQAGNIIKLADVDWNFATGISLSSGYSATNGTVAIADSVEVAIEKLDGNQNDLTTLSGVAQGSTDLGAFTGTTIPDSQTNKQALQSLETAHEEVDQNVNDLITLSGVAENSTDNGLMDQGEILSDGATTNALLKETDAELTKQRGKTSALAVAVLTTLDSILVDDIVECVWHVTFELASDPTRRKAVIVHAFHNGTGAADATDTDDTVYARLRIGSNFNRQVSVDISGAGAAQVMRLRVNSSEPGGVNVYAKRIETLF